MGVRSLEQSAGINIIMFIYPLAAIHPDAAPGSPLTAPGTDIVQESAKARSYQPHLHRPVIKIRNASSNRAMQPLTTGAAMDVPLLRIYPSL